MDRNEGKTYKSGPSAETMKDLVERGYRPEGYKFPLWVDATDALSPKEMEKEEKRWMKQNPARAGAAEANTAKAEIAHGNRLSTSSGRMGGGGGGGGMKPDTDITASRKLPKMKSGGTVKSASKRADGIATKGKTRGRII